MSIPKKTKVIIESDKMSFITHILITAVFGGTGWYFLNMNNPAKHFIWEGLFTVLGLTLGLLVYASFFYMKIVREGLDLEITFPFRFWKAPSKFDLRKVESLSISKSILGNETIKITMRDTKKILNYRYQYIRNLEPLYTTVSGMGMRLEKLPVKAKK